MNDRKGLRHISVTMKEIYDALRPNVYKNKKKYTRKTKHKKDGKDLQQYFHYDENSKTWRCFDRSDWRTFWNSKKSMLIGKGKTPEEAHRNLKKLVNEKN